MATHHMLAVGLEGLFPIIIIVGIIVVKGLVAAAKQRQAREEQTRRAAEEPSSRPKPARAPASKISSFLEEVARQAGAPVTSRQPRPKPAQPPVPKAQPATASPAGTPSPTAQRVVVQQRVRSPKAGSLPQHPAKMPHLEKRKVSIAATAKQKLAPTPEAAPGAAPALDTAARLETILRLSPLARAIVLREVLGPCRAVTPHQPFVW